MPRPRRGAAREAGRADRRCGGSEAEAHGVLPLDDRTIELFGARFRDRLAAPGRPALHATGRRCRRCRPRPARRSAGAAGTSTAAIDRPAGDERRALRHRHRELRPEPVRRRTTGWCSTTTASATTSVVESDVDGPGRARRWSACASAATDARPATSTLVDRRCRLRLGCDLPFVMRMISSVGAERRLRPRLTGERSLLRTRSRSRAPCTRSTSSSSPRAKPPPNVPPPKHAPASPASSEPTVLAPPVTNQPFWPLISRL